MEHLPYCGGANPSSLQAQGYSLPLQNQIFLIMAGALNRDSIPIYLQAGTNGEGHFKCDMELGNYSLIFPEKHQPFESFYQAASVERGYLKAGSRECFFEWWQRPEATFQISDTTSQLTCVIKAYCNSDLNPCLVFTGPKRP